MCREYILKYRPSLPTQQLVRVYRETKGQNETSSVRPASFFPDDIETFQCHASLLTWSCLYLENQGGWYKMLSGRWTELWKILSKLDRDTVVALLSKITSVHCIMKLSIDCVIQRPCVL